MDNAQAVQDAGFIVRVPDFMKQSLCHLIVTLCGLELACRDCKDPKGRADTGKPVSIARTLPQIQSFSGRRQSFCVLAVSEKSRIGPVTA